jgi:hypothetical protein
MPRKLTIEEMHKLAESRGGKCLSVKYVNTKTKLSWECGKNHVWLAEPGCVKNKGNWCPQCSSNKLTIEEMWHLAKARGGECLSTEYVGINTKLEWKCKDGHIWSAIPSSIKNKGSWCPQCYGNAKLGIEEMQELAELRGGGCLSLEYVNKDTKLEWKCKKGHTWLAKPGHVKNSNSWCPQCYGNARLSIEEMQEFAGSKGGQCLSTEYNGGDAKLKWKCGKGHEWDATPNNVKNVGSWCPYCRLKNESDCRTIFETLSGRNFVKCRPEWLQGLELDGYCEELGIAFEYNGEQHYVLRPAWHKNGVKDLEQQQERDARKAELCENNSIVLVVIPYTIQDKVAFIAKALEGII